MKINPESLTRSSSRHPWRVVIVWVVLVAAMGVAAGTLLGGVLGQDIAFTSKPDSVKAQDLIGEKFEGLKPGEKAPQTEFVIVQSQAAPLFHQMSSCTPGQEGCSPSWMANPGAEAVIRGVQSSVGALTDVIASPPATYMDLAQQSPEQAAGLVSADGTVTLMPVVLKDSGDDAIEELRSALKASETNGYDVMLAGQASLQHDFSKLAEEDARKGEAVGLLFALIVLVIVFAALIAALLPISMALVAIPVSLGLVSLIGQVVHFNLFVVNMISMIGLAVGIDYSLFIVSRYREERKKGREKMDAIGVSGGTASRAVFFSGMTVVLALLGMFIIPTNIFRSLATGAVLVTLISIAASLTLLPAMLALLGDKIDWPKLGKRAHLDTPHDAPGGFWDRVTRGVMARPALYLVISIGVLAALGSFYFDMNKGSATGIEQLPDTLESKPAFMALQTNFAGGLTEPARIVVTGEGVGTAEVTQAVENLRHALSEDPAFAPVMPLEKISADGSTIQIEANLRGDPNSSEAFDAISQIRDDLVPQAFGNIPDVEVYVGGQSAFFADFLGVADQYQLLVLAFVLSLSFILLTVVFRSIVVPIKAILMNLLSVGAAYGAVVLVFQKGVGIGFFNAIGFNFNQSDAIEAWLPLFLFSVLFGLSMDYHVFLLSRIREEYDKTGDNAEAVAYGLRTTAGIITGAALIMVVVFTSFAAGRLAPLQQMGFGLAVAVLMDATIIRTLVVPASMRLLGDRNWYLPKWLEWLPKVNVEGSEPGAEPTPVPSAMVADTSDPA